jgi:hypothetical protein
MALCIYLLWFARPSCLFARDIVFARHATHSDAARGHVGKLKYAFTGPWHVKASLHGGSYLLEHCHNAACTEKKHAANLAPYPPEMIPFEPVDGADTRYGQLYKPIREHPFKEAGIRGFIPPSPFLIPANFLDVGEFKDFCRPTLTELISKLEPFPWGNDEERQMVMSNDDPISLPVMHNGPPPSLPIASKPEPSAPMISTLAPLIISSTDKLFFITHKIGTADCYEWRLVCVAFRDSVSLYSSCLQDGCFLIEFYMAHPADACYNAISQSFWLQYHDRNGPIFSTMDAHLITLSDTSADCAACHHLITVRSWVNLTHVTRIYMAHLTLLSSVAARLVITLDKICGTRSLLKL